MTHRSCSASIVLLAVRCLAGCSESTVDPMSPQGTSSGGSEGAGSSEGEASGGAEGAEELECEQLEAATLAVLEGNCAKCHGPSSSALGSIDYVTDLNALIENGKIVPGAPADSPITRRMRSEDAPMPPSSETTRPSSADITLVEAWVERCAGATSCAETPWIDRETVIDAIRDDLLDTTRISADARQFIRYFSLVHLHNAGWCSDEIDIHRHALAKLVNSLSQDTKVVPPEAIDEDALLFRIDLRDYDWDREVPEASGEEPPGETFRDVWELVVANDPYAIEFEGDSADDVKSATGTRVFTLQADAFLQIATLPPLYHEIVGIPETRRELEQRLGLDPLENAIVEEIRTDPDRVARAAFHDSGVSQNHRVIERHDFPDNSTRAYWISYDFATNGGDANVFVRPFGNASVETLLDPDGQPEFFDGFVEAGSEIIFNLPNGMQAYMVTDANGARIDEAPIEIVQDKNADDGIVRNGISCMGCHSDGMIMAEDDLRWEVDQGFGEGDFSQDELDAIRALHPSREDMSGLLKLDADRFQHAVENAGVPTGVEREPIVTVFLAFDEDVGLRRAAAELWTTETTLREKLGELDPDLDDLGKEATGVRRDVFTAAFAQAVCELKVGRSRACP